MGLEIVWGIYKLNKEKEALIREQKKEELNEQLKDLPPEILDQLSSRSTGTKPKKQAVPVLSDRDIKKLIDSNRV